MTNKKRKNRLKTLIHNKLVSNNAESALHN